MITDKVHQSLEEKHRLEQEKKEKAKLEQEMHRNKILKEQEEERIKEYQHKL